LKKWKPGGFRIVSFCEVLAFRVVKKMPNLGDTNSANIAGNRVNHGKPVQSLTVLNWSLMGYTPNQLSGMMFYHFNIVPHKAAAEVSKKGNL
jgi:hypothetical protein